MALSRARRSTAPTNFWPGFVDAMATLLLVLTFLLSIFMLAQYFVTQEVTGKDTALQRLNQQIAQLTELLALERSNKQSLEENVAALTASLAELQDENKKLKGLVDLGQGEAKAAKSQLIVVAGKLEEQKKISDEALAKVELLNLQMAALRRQIAALNAALDAAEKAEKESKTRIADLGRRLNLALARKVQELSRYRSDFFGKLREVLGNRKDIRIEGDRFVFQSEVLFPSGSAELNPEAKPQLDAIAQAIKEISKKIPPDINWVLRVDGHTDKRPINSPQFPSNWELSSARATSVVRYLISQGVPPNRLVAAGFGEFQPIDPGDSEEALRRNRRIEFKLTTK